MGELNLSLPEGILDGTRVMQKIHNNMVFLNDKIWVNNTAPDLPFKGQLWWDKDGNALYAWNGTSWQGITTGGDHGLLTGLGDDDHTQYVLKSGNITQITIRSHTSLTDIGNNTHTQIDTAITNSVNHIADNTIHFTVASISHTAIADKGVNTHVQIDTHITNAGNYLLLQPTADVVINDAHGDFNFRIEGDTNANLFFLDAGLDKICIGGAVPNEILTIDGVLSLKESSAPSATADYGKLYVKSYSGLSPAYSNRLYYMDETGTEYDLTAGGLISSVFGRTGIIVATQNDYTWAQINKGTSSIADITTKTHSLLSSLVAPADDHTQYLLIAGTRAMTGDLGITATKKLILDTLVGHTYFVESADGVLDAYAGAVNTIRSSATAITLNVDTTIVATKKLLLTADAGTYFVESADNVLDIYVGTVNTIKSSATLVTVGVDLAIAGDIIYNADNKGIRADTADGADNQNTYICGGGDRLVSRGGFILLSGNEDANTGSIYMFAGNVAGGTIKIATGNGADALIIDASGRVTQPLQPFCRAWLSNAQDNLAGNAAADILINLNDDSTARKGFDVGSNFATDTHLFTVPVTGCYLLTGSVGFNNSLLGYTLIAKIKKANATVTTLSENDFIVMTNLQVAILPIASTIMNLTEGDTIGLYCYIVGALSTIDLMANSEYTFLCCALIN